ncbi:MAG: GntR family transcriptional regulator [Mycolicibacterium sp.]|nr:GntR family transcriptional regulator [Mycolicibacterium sp.]
MEAPTGQSPVLGRPQLVDDIASHIRRRIFDGSLAGGEFVRIEQIAQELGTSSTPVREAMLTLRGEGLVEQQPRRGFVVVPVTEQDVRDVSDVQAYLGGQLAERAAKALDSTGLARLHLIETSLEAAFATGDADGAVRLNHEFHRLINHAAASPKLTQFMSNVIRYVPESVFPTLDGWDQRAIADHRRILAALERGDAAEARAAMSAHFVSGVDHVVAHLTRNGVLAPPS